MKAEREEQYKPKPVITILDEDEKNAKDKEINPAMETEPIETDSDDGIQFEDSVPVETSRTPPRSHHHHRRHHRYYQNHHHDMEDDHLDSDRAKDKRLSPSANLGTPAQIIQTIDDDSRMSVVSEPEKTSSSKHIF